MFNFNAFSWDIYFFLQTYTIECNNKGKNCKVTPPPTEPIVISSPSDTNNPLELALSPELSMFFAYLLRFFIFHLVGILLCWACTFSFRRSPRR